MDETQATQADLTASLTRKFEATGWTTRLTGGLLTAEKEAILATWLLGRRKVKHSLLLRLDTPAHILTMREVSTETSIGIPPPLFSVTVSKQRGREVVGERFDTGVGGGGALHYGAAREWIEQECASAGWKFRLAIGPV